MQSLDLLDPKKLKPLEDGLPPHPHLAIHKGDSCDLCEYRSTSQKLVKRHRSKEHGRDVFRNGLHGSGVHGGLRLQSWTHNGAGGYWIVYSTNSLLGRLAAVNTESSPGRRRRVAALHEAETRRLTEWDWNRSATDTGIDDLALTSNWMRRTNWACTFDGVDRRLLLRFAERPTPNGNCLVLGNLGTTSMFSDAMDEQRLLAIGPAIDRFFDRCEDTVRHTDTSIRC